MVVSDIESSKSSHEFTATYTDNWGFTLAPSGGVYVLGPGGTMSPQMVERIEHDRSHFELTLRITPRDGLSEFPSSYNGRYQILVSEDRIQDPSRNSAPAQIVGSFEIRIPDALAGDVNGDGIVGFVDFLVVAFNYGRQVDAAFQDGDFTGDGKVAFDDFLLLSNSYGA